VVGANDSSGLLSIPYYLSPERARGDQTLEPANDIFIAAAIGYESLTAQKAFSATSWAGLMQLIARGQPTPLGTLRPDTPEELQQLLMRALSAQPRTRPQSAREMQDELRAVFEGTRRGSTQVRAAAAPAPPSLSDSSVHTPRRILEADTPGSFETVPGVSATHARPSSASAVRVAHEHIPSTSTERPGEPPPTTGDDYEDETRTDQKLALTAAERLQAGMNDEASADHPIRTVRPPSPNASLDIEIDVEVEHDEPATSRGQDLATVLGLPLRPRGENEEEETETMQLTPEMRARIEQMSKTATTAAMPVSSVEDSSRPPPTRRLTKPPRR
jgi:serine/threonine protein kinase